MSDAAKEALAIEAPNILNQAALEQHLRLRSPQNWTSLVAIVDFYISTMYTSGAEPTPMEIGAVSMHTDRACLCCGKQGHVKADCRFKDAEVAAKQVTCRTSARATARAAARARAKARPKARTTTRRFACAVARSAT